MVFYMFVNDKSCIAFKFFQLLHAVSQMASLGFEKSYRETVVLMTRSYLDKLKSLGCTESETLPPEAITERVEVWFMFLNFNFSIIFL